MQVYACALRVNPGPAGIFYIFYRLRKYFFKEFFLLAAVLAADGGAPEFGGGGPGDQDQIERVGDGIELNETFFR